MSIFRAILDAGSERPFLIVTPADVRAFADFDECEKSAETITGEFVVLRLLWTGGTAAEQNETGTTEHEMRRREADLQARSAMRLYSKGIKGIDPDVPARETPERPPSPLLDKEKAKRS